MLRSTVMPPFPGVDLPGWSTGSNRILQLRRQYISAAPGGGYTSKSGTSMAAPFVTGSCALLMEWGIVRGNDPYLYSEKVKAYLIRGTKKLPAFTEYPNPYIGWGTLCTADSIPT